MAIIIIIVLADIKVTLSQKYSYSYSHLFISKKLTKRNFAMHGENKK